MKSEHIIKNITDGKFGFNDKYISDRKALVSIVQALKDSGYKIVLTQGVYDLFHVGHKRYLENAKSHGDILIVGVDSDELTRMRKGPSRPFDKLVDRLEILASLRVVDIVTTRTHKEDMNDLIMMVRPHALILSGTTSDFATSISKLKKYCGTIKILPAQASTSTTAKLRKMMLDGAEQLGREITSLINNFLKGINHNESSRSLPSSHSQRSSRVLPKTKPGETVRTGKNTNR